MTTYSCQIHRNGVVSREVVEASDEGAARAALRARGIEVIRISAERSLLDRLRSVDFHIGHRRYAAIGAASMQLIVEELASLIGAGLPVLKALEILSRRCRKDVSDSFLRRVTEKVRSGSGLAAALEPEVEECGVPALLVTTVRVGEMSGELEDNLRRFAAHLERSRALRSRVVSAMVYPATLLAVSAVVVTILMIVVVPRLAGLYASHDAELPFITRALMFSSTAIKRFFLPLSVAAGLAWVAARRWGRGIEGRRYLDRLFLRIPLLGELQRLYLGVEVCQTLSTLLRAGTPAVEALRITSTGVSNVEYGARLAEASSLVSGGSSFHAALEARGVLTGMGLELVEVGELTGALDAMFDRIARVYDETLERRLSWAVALLEPALLVAMGVLVAVILLGMYLPLFQAVQVIG